MMLPSFHVIGISVDKVYHTSIVTHTYNYFNGRHRYYYTIKMRIPGDTNILNYYLSVCGNRSLRFALTEENQHNNETRKVHTTRFLEKEFHFRAHKNDTNTVTAWLWIDPDSDLAVPMTPNICIWRFTGKTSFTEVHKVFVWHQGMAPQGTDTMFHISK